MFAGIRPAAVAGSLCVSAGKGATVLEAQIGAFMEAMELAAAEPIKADERIVVAGVDQLAGLGRPIARLADLCPLTGRSIAHVTVIESTVAHDLVTGLEVLIPAELVFVPYVPKVGPALFGSSSNGLASGNSLPEATLHALLELLERDVLSFARVRDTSRRVNLESLPPPALELARAIRDADMRLSIRWLSNEFGVSVVTAHIADPMSFGPAALVAGYGCHWLPEIAVVRAITEAAQSRLSIIHGGRDDLETTLRRPSPIVIDEHTGGWRFAAEPRLENSNAMDFDSLRGAQPVDDSPQAVISKIIESLRAIGIQQVYRTVLSKTDSPLPVVRVVIPKLEYWDLHLPRRGPRLLTWAANDAF